MAQAELGRRLDSGNILLEAALSFLGPGVRPPQPSWGNMLNEASR